MLVDSHCHLDYLARDGDLDAVIARARAAGVGCMLTIGTRLTEFDAVHAIAMRHREVYCTVGIHPHEAATAPVDLAAQLIALAQRPKVVGIGETGLDYYYDNSPRDLQQACFREHIEAARATGLPLVVHTRSADADAAAMLRMAVTAGRVTGVLHCFSSGKELADAAVALGFFISISGIVTFKNADELRRIVETVLPDHLLVETDAPYLAPAPQRGQRNEPAFVVHTAAAVAALKRVTPDDLAATTSDNFFRLFNRAERPAA